MGDLVAAVAVQQSSVHDWMAQIQGVSSVIVQLEVQSNDLAFLREAHLHQSRLQWTSVLFDACINTLLFLAIALHLWSGQGTWKYQEFSCRTNCRSFKGRNQIFRPYTALHAKGNVDVALSCLDNKYLVFANEGMTMPRCVHVLISVLNQPDGAPQFPGWNAGSTSQGESPGLLTPKSSSQTLGPGNNLVCRDTQCLCHYHLVVHWALQGNIYWIILLVISMIGPLLRSILSLWDPLGIDLLVFAALPVSL